ncbi:MAG: response regulator [Lachnospiraceae bacterium]|nr:response regulator [Lachnospiraceae bacterium]
MNSVQNNRTTRIAAAGILLVVLMLIAGTLWTGRSAQKDTVEAARSVSRLYLDELAGRREQVVKNNINNNIRVIDVALGLLNEADLQDPEHLSDYQRRLKLLFELERFAFVDEDGFVYTADEGIQNDIDRYSFDYKTISEPLVFVRNLDSIDKKVIIAAPTRDRDLYVGDRHLVACYMEIDMDNMLSGVSMGSQDSDFTFCNIYTSDGIALSNTVLGGLAVEDNLLEALRHAEYKDGSTVEKVISDFAEGRKGTVSFTYNGIDETLSYVPVNGTNWLLTYLVREKAINDRISAVSSGIILRSVILSAVTALVLGMMFAYLIMQLRKNAALALEKETAEVESRIKHEEMEHRLELQEEILRQKAEREQQEKMIVALASDYRSVYYLELDKNHGICYQSRSDLDGFKAGEDFPYLEAVTAYCNQYVLPEYREEFLRFIQPDAIRESLKENLVISYRYMISVGGAESWEAVRFAGVRHPEDRDDNVVHNVGACFMNVDTETRKDLAQQQALTEALAAAEQASKAKTVFLSNMSHEIRTPMNAIIGLNNIALNEPDVPEKVRGHLKMMGDSAQHLLGIINDILDMSRIESGRMVIKNEEFSFAKNLEQVNTIISGQCAEKGLNYDCHSVGTIDDHYIGDGMKLKQVMINILSNAVKFTPRGGSVTFLIKEERRYKGQVTLKFVISDTGIGMSKEFLPHLFDPFSQEDSSSTSRYGSTGLGMPITKSIVELMNGHIEVESEKGSGTTFTVTVTLEEAAHRNRADAEAEAVPRDMSVLVIDDDPIALEHAQIVLKQIGVSCDIAASGKEGVEKVRLRHGRREDYDLLLVDWKMPDMDGVETTRRIRSIVGNETPVIILTSYNWDEIADEARAAGVDTFVPKPLFAGSVMDEFREAFKRKNRDLIQERADLKGRRVLLAEDVAVNAEIMIMVLSMREIEADLAENGRIAVDKYESHEAGYYDAILMDMRMPEMDGLTATKAIRDSGREDAMKIPIIALTANAFDEDVQRSLQAGLNAHLSKPVDPDALFDTLETLIRP